MNLAGLRPSGAGVIRTTVLMLALATAGCAGEGGDPGASSLPLGQSCSSLRTTLNRLLARGAQWKVEALSAGRKLSPADKADAENYNKALNQYLGARCHV